MITVSTQIPTDNLTDVERSQMERHDWAVDSWKQGDIEKANIFLDAVLAEDLTPRMAARCFVSRAAFRAEAGDYAGSLESIDQAAPFIDEADLQTQGSFHNQRARLHNRQGNVDAALMDYAGASACFEVAGEFSLGGAALLNVSELYLQKKDLDQARTYIDRALPLLIESDSVYLPQAFDTLANLELACGQIEKAVIAIERAFQLVGENEIWRQDFLKTRNKIREKIKQVSSALHGVNVEMVRWALIKTNGNLTHAGNLTGLNRKGVSFIIDRHPELEAFRVKRRTRTKLKSVFKTKS